MASCTFSDTIMRWRMKPRKWKRWNAPSSQGLPFPIHMANWNGHNDLETMNENAQTAALAEQGGDQGSDQSGESQSSTAGRSGAKPSLFDRLLVRFRPRNGSSLREDLADALSEQATADTAA